MDKFVVTPEEVAVVKDEPLLSSAPQPKLPPAIPLLWKVAIAPLVLVLPVLCLFALVMRLALRSQNPRTRHLWDAYFCTLLIVSGVIFTGAMAFVISTGVGKVPVSTGLAEFDERDSFPKLPEADAVLPRDLSKALKPLVVIASPPAKLWFNKELTPSGTIGTAFLLQADSAGYLFATARHVVDGESWAKSAVGSSDVLLTTLQGGWSGAKVVARHTGRDVALLWVPRHEGKGDFCQPVMAASDINSGDPVFVIGHPEGLNFSLSTGIVSRLAGDRTLQISAPISPGNSGGPVYDSRGTLLAIVSYTFNKALAPNAENLNFAVDADVLYDAAGWTFEKSGEDKLNNFKKVCGSPAAPITTTESK